jgi:FtsH-binding integral membrane protein
MSDQKAPSMFSRENYTWMLIGLLVMAVGMFLLSGGASNKDPKIFDKDAVYSTTRITIAPIVILAGLVIEIYAIFKKPRLNAAGQTKEKIA